MECESYNANEWNRTASRIRSVRLYRPRRSERERISVSENIEFLTATFKVKVGKYFEKIF